MTAYYKRIEAYERTLFKFDRHTFNPEKNPAHAIVINYLRQQGTMRCRAFLHYQYPKVYPKPIRCTWAYSQPFRSYVDSEFYSPKDVMLDIGCGNSPDRLLCDLHDMTGYGCDLFPPLAEFKELQKGFYLCDVVEWLPFGSYSVDCVFASAMLDLIKPVERVLVYANVFRVLKIGGVFVPTFVRLKNGWGFDLETERELLKRIGFVHVKGNYFQKQGEHDSTP